MTGGEQAGAADRLVFSEAELAAGWRLGCQAKVQHNTVVHVPVGSLFGGLSQIQAASATGAVEAVEPAVRKVYVELAPPTLEENTPDLLRLEQKVGLFTADGEVIRELPRLLREEGFRGTAVLADHQLIDFEAGDTTRWCFGAAFDLGTTTLVGSLVDLKTGDEVAVVSGVNPQVRIGDDVVSRIRHAGEPGGLDDLRQAVVGEIDAIVGRLCAAANVDRRSIYEITVSGNTTMEHLLCGIDPSALGQMPFVPTFGRGLLLRAADLGVRVHSRAPVYVFPVIGGFVGGDTVGGILTTGLADAEGPSLMVDVGTNGEIVLSHQGQLWAASTAAGPSFEGARISCGMRAGKGAIEKVVLARDLRISVIGDPLAEAETAARSGDAAQASGIGIQDAKQRGNGVRPVGLCGSGLIDLVAELLRVGIVSSAGRLLPPDMLPGDLPDGIRKRIRLDPAGKVEFLLVEAVQSGTGADLVITQRDVRELQLAAGAIRAGIRIVLRQMGLTPGDLTRVQLAGGFGSFIRRSNARQIGLLPPELESHHIHYVGNTSLSGARWVLLSRRVRQQAEDLARRTRHVELSMDPNFQIEFGEAMLFPEPLES
jgi:uncharacterized 2Fe-2S/4Fe-4S cluster protein (DUF4445 family)